MPKKIKMDLKYKLKKPNPLLKDKIIARKISID